VRDVHHLGIICQKKKNHLGIICQK